MICAEDDGIETVTQRLDVDGIKVTRTTPSATP